jgi:hypothetical protein
VAKDDDAEDLLPPPKKAGAAKLVGASSTSRSPGAPSRPMLRLIRLARAVGVLVGGFVALVGLMSLVGIVTELFWVRFAGAAVLGIAVPAFVADRMLKRTGAGGGLAGVIDVFAIVLLGIALAFVGLEGLTRGVLRDEGDRYARGGSLLMARAVYLLAGVSPRFPGDADWRGAGSSASGPAKGAADGGAPDGGAR